MSKTYTVTVQEDAEGNAFIELPPELLKQLDWNEGDDLVWDETEICEQVFVDRIAKLRNFDETIAVADDLLKHCEDNDDGEFKGAILYKYK